MAQFARPSSDGTTDGTWVNESGASTNLFESINEVTASDVDWFQSPGAPTDANSYQTGLSSVTDPAVSTDHVVRYRLGKMTGAGAFVTSGQEIRSEVRLRQGNNGTVIATWDHLNLGLPATFSQTLSGAEADAITDYGTLFLEFDPRNFGAGAGRALGITWAELEVPDAGGAALLKVVNESAQISEADLTVRGLILTVNESVDISITDLSPLALTRTVDETASISELVIKAPEYAVFRRTPQTGSIFDPDVDIPIATVLGSPYVDSNLADGGYDYQVFRRIGAGWSVGSNVEQVTVSTGGVALLKIKDESVGVTEEDLQFLELTRQVGEVANVVEEDLSFLALIKTESESVQISDQDLALIDLLRIVSESSNLLETEIHIVTPFGVAIVKVQGEGIQVSDTDISQLGLFHVEDESTSISEADLRRQALARLVSESLSPEETILTLRSLTREQGESIELPEGTIRARGMIQTHQETAEVAETPSHVRGLPARIINEVTQISESAFSSIAVVVTGVLRKWRSFRGDRDYNARDRDYD